MGLFGKIFKGIGKVFKKVGKFIKKGFAKVGKFMNKFGILGQIGMMVMSYGIGSMAMAGLKALGSSFMSGLSSAGWTTATAATSSAATATGAAATAIPSGFAAAAPSAAGAVAGTQVAAAGPIAGMARVAHGVLEGAAKIAAVPGKVVGTITDQVVGTVTDVAKAFGNSMKMKMKIGLDPVTGKLAEGAVTYDDIFSNAVNRFKTGKESVMGAFKDAKEMLQAAVPGGEAYGTDYQTFVDPSSGEKITRNLKYSTANRELAAEAAQVAQEKVIKRQDDLETEAYKSDATKQAIIEHNAEQAKLIRQTQQNAIDRHNQQVQDYLKTGDANVFDATPPPTEVLDTAFQTQLQASGSQSLLDATASQSGDYFGRKNIQGLDPKFLKTRLSAGTDNPKDFASLRDFGRAGEGAVATKVQSAFNEAQQMEPTRYSMGPLRSGTPGIVDFTQEQVGINQPVLTAFVEDRAGVADPNNDWNSFFNNANARFGFGRSRPVMGGNFANV